MLLQQSNQSSVGAPCIPLNPLPRVSNTTSFPFPTYPPESLDLSLAAPQQGNISKNPFTAHQTDLTYPLPPGIAHVNALEAHSASHSHHHQQHRRYSATGAPSTRLLHLPPPLLQCACDSQNLFERSTNDEHTSGLGSSIEADSHHSSFSHPLNAVAPPSTAPLTNPTQFAAMETSFNEDVGIDIPARVPGKHMSAHSPLQSSSAASSASSAAAVAVAAAAALVMGCPRRKFGVIERPPALAEQLSRYHGSLSAATQYSQLHQQLSEARRSVTMQQHHHQQQQQQQMHPTQQQPYNGMDF